MKTERQAKIDTLCNGCWEAERLSRAGAPGNEPTDVASHIFQRATDLGCDWAVIREAADQLRKGTMASEYTREVAALLDAAVAAEIEAITE